MNQTNAPQQPPNETASAPAPHGAAPRPRAGVPLPILLGFLCGVGVFAALDPQERLIRAWHALTGLPAPDAPPASAPAAATPGAAKSTSKSKGNKRKALAAHALPLDSPSEKGGSALAGAEGAAGTFYVGADVLESFAGEMEALLFGSSGADVGGRVSLEGGSLIVTRGQFLDVVTRHMPSSLPTGSGREGALFYATTDADVGGDALRASLANQEIPHDTLCAPKRLDPHAFRRVSLVFHATRANLACARSFLASFATKGAPAAAQGAPLVAAARGADTEADASLEISLVALGRGDGYYAARNETGRRFSLQTWSAEWLDHVMATWDDDASLPRPVSRARKLASVARALSKPSDVVLEVPLAPFAPRAGSPDRDGSATLAFGNFVAFPRAALAGTFKARRVGAGLSRSKGKEAVTTVAPGTEVLILSGVGNGLKFEAVAK